MAWWSGMLAMCAMAACGGSSGGGNNAQQIVSGASGGGAAALFHTGSLPSPQGTITVTVPAGSILYDGCKQAPCLVEIVGDGDDPEFMVDENGKTIPAPKGN